MNTQLTLVAPTPPAYPLIEWVPLSPIEVLRTKGLEAFNHQELQLVTMGPATQDQHNLLLKLVHKIVRRGHKYRNGQVVLRRDRYGASHVQHVFYRPHNQPGVLTVVIPAADGGLYVVDLDQAPGFLDKQAIDI